MAATRYTYLDRIESPADLRKLTLPELEVLAGELRDFMVSELSTNPGHLGSSLGAVELAMALHYVYDTPEDKIIWDVGHQAYAHKILTGRREAFHTNRKLNGISGFPRMSESSYDAFGAGHASVSISGRTGHRPGQQAAGHPPQRGGGDRRRCPDRRTGLRGAQQRRRLECRHARDPQRQPHVDQSQRGRAHRIPARHHHLASLQPAEEQGLECHVGRSAPAPRNPELRQPRQTRHSAPEQPVRKPQLPLFRAGGRPRSALADPGLQRHTPHSRPQAAARHHQERARATHRPRATRPYGTLRASSTPPRASAWRRPTRSTPATRRSSAIRCWNLPARIRASWA